MPAAFDAQAEIEELSATPGDPTHVAMIGWAQATLPIASGPLLAAALFITLGVSR